MRTLFVAVPFGRFEMGNYLPPAVLGQDVTAQDSDPDILNISKDIESILKEVPKEALGAYQSEYDQCRNLLRKGGLVGLATGGKCLRDLYNKIRDAMKGKGPAPVTPAPVVAPPSEGFPVVPVALAAVGGIALIYGLTKL